MYDDLNEQVAAGLITRNEMLAKVMADLMTTAVSVFNPGSVELRGSVVTFKLTDEPEGDYYLVVDKTSAS